MLSINGLIIGKGILRNVLGARTNELISKLTLTYRRRIGPPIVTKVYKMDYTNYILPRSLITYLGKLTKITIQLPPEVKINIKEIPKLYPHQKIITEYLVKTIFNNANINQGQATCILNLRAGAGKTFIAAGLIAKSGLRTCYITARQHLANQAANDLSKCFPYLAVTKSKNPVALASSDISILVINSALTKSPEFYSKYSLIILDEVHMYCSEVRKEIFFLTNTRCVLGMSATTSDRTDGFDKIFMRHLGAIIYADKIPGVVIEDTKFHLKVTMLRYHGPATHTKTLTHASTDLPFVHYMYGQFLDDEYRCQLVVSVILELYAANHSIYVFAEERDHVAKIMKLVRIKMMNTSNIVEIDDKGEPILDVCGYFVGGLKDDQINHIKNTSRIVFTTYGLSATGTSWPHMTAMVLVTPRKYGTMQLAARIMRLGYRHDVTREIIDIVDSKTCLQHQARHRMIDYDHYEAEVIEEKIKYTDIDAVEQSS